jgi:peptide/nickel transport system permease protein
MAALGLVILALSIVIAFIAPVLYPFDPMTTQIGAPYAPPEWVSNFPEGYYLSKNVQVVHDPLFSTPAALQEWQYSTPPGQNALVTVSWWGKHAGIVGGGSLQLSSQSQSPVTVRVSKTFNYPYFGPPRSFSAEPSYCVVATGVDSSHPVDVRFFIDSLKGKTYNLWTTTITKNDSCIGSPTQILSETRETREQVGLLGHGPLSTAGIIFPGAGDYAYGFEATFHGLSMINVTKVGLILFGSAAGMMGTDALGHDLFAQDLHGTRISLVVGLVASFIGISLGLLVGLIAGYKTGLTDEILMRFTDMMLVIPVLPLLIVLIAVLGASIQNLIIVLGFLGWMGFARVIRSQVLTLKERPFIEAAKAAGAGTRQILTRHIFPNIVSLTYVNLALTVPAAILAEAALSFLGLGDPTLPSWGHVLYYAEVYQAFDKWWWIIPPGIAIAAVSLSFVFIGYALDEIFNPKLRKRR